MGAVGKGVGKGIGAGWGLLARGVGGVARAGSGRRGPSNRDTDLDDFHDDDLHNDDLHNDDFYDDVEAAAEYDDPDLGAGPRGGRRAGDRRAQRDRAS
ncbi:hypothetical protein B1964_08740, partial [Gordonia sp. i37]